MPVIHFSAELGFRWQFPRQRSYKANGLYALLVVLAAFGVEAGHRKVDRKLRFLWLVLEFPELAAVGSDVTPDETMTFLINHARNSENRSGSENVVGARWG